MKIIPKKYKVPSKFKKFYRKYKDLEFLLLDVGCGNHSPSCTKEWFNQCRYYGIDNCIYNNDDIDFQLMEEFYKIDLSQNLSMLDIIPNDFFDIVIFTHVIEHLKNGLEVLAELTKKIKCDGYLYIEFPSIKSLSLPNMYGTLNFCDDPTHVRLYSIDEVANVLLINNMKIIRGGTRRDFYNILKTPINVIRHLQQYKRLEAYIFWDITGFVNYVYAEKKPG